MPSAVDRRQRARQRLDLGGRLLADRDDLPQLAARDRVDRQHDQVDALPLDHPRDLVAPAEHLPPVDQHAVLADVVVHEPDHLVALAERPVLKLPAEVLAGLARADDQHPGHPGRRRRSQAPPGPTHRRQRLRAVAGSRHPAEREEPAQEDHRERHRAEARPGQVQPDDRNRRNPDRDGQRHQVLRGREAPPAPVDPERLVARHHDDGSKRREPERRPVLEVGGDAAHQQRQGVGRPDQWEVHDRPREETPGNCRYTCTEVPWHAAPCETARVSTPPLRVPSDRPADLAGPSQQSRRFEAYAGGRPEANGYSVRRASPYSRPASPTWTMGWPPQRRYAVLSEATRAALTPNQRLPRSAPISHDRRHRRRHSHRFSPSLY